MNKLLTDQRAIVTGGTRGIGKAIALRLSEQGAQVALFGTNAERGKAAEAEIPNSTFYQVDVGNLESVEAAIKQIDGVDILVNNAGITRDQLLMKLKPEDWAQVIETNLTSVFHTCRAVIRPMMKARHGKIINITSVVGLMGNAGQTNYAASKAGMIGFTKSLAKEVGARGISVNCIAPGFIKTDMTDVLPDAQKEALLKMIPMGRLGEASEIADATLFLASPMASYVTGQVLTVDGGMVM